MSGRLGWNVLLWSGHLKDGLVWLQEGTSVQQDTSPDGYLSRALVHSEES